MSHFNYQYGYWITTILLGVVSLTNIILVGKLRQSANSLRNMTNLVKRINGRF